jgi:hypothetical protein
VRPAEQIMVAIGGWVLLQILAAAYARGATAGYPAIRYGDTLAIGALANGALLAARLFPAQSSDGVASRPSFELWSASALWLVVLAAGVQETLERNFGSELPGQVAYYRNAEKSVRDYLATDDPAHLLSPDIPYPSADTLVERLSHPALRARMPASVRAALPLRAAHDGTTNTPSAFHESPSATAPGTPPLSTQKVVGSFSPEGATGQWMSAPLQSPLGGWLVFKTAGQLGEAGTSLALHDAVTGVSTTPIRPTGRAGENWRAAYVDVSRQSFVVVARDTDPKRWFAFSAPTEMASLSYRAWALTKHGMLVLYISAAAAFAVGSWGLIRRAEKRPARVAEPSPC